MVFEFLISSTTSLPLLLAISLEEDGRGSDSFQAIVNLILKMRCW